MVCMVTLARRSGAYGGSSRGRFLSSFDLFLEARVLQRSIAKSACFLGTLFFGGMQSSKTHSGGKKDLPESTASFEQNRKVKSAYQCCQSSKSGDSGRMKFLSSRHTDNIDRPIPLYDNDLF